MEEAKDVLVGRSDDARSSTRACNGHRRSTEPGMRWSLVRYASACGVWELGVETERNGAKESATKGCGEGKGKKSARTVNPKENERRKERKNEESDEEKEEEDVDDDKEDEEKKNREEKKKGASDGE